MTNTPNNFDNKRDNDVLEPEIVSEEQYSRHRQSPYSEQSQYQQSQSQSFGRGTTFVFNNNTQLQKSCLPGIISLVLTLAAFIQFGFLGALGFVFFTLIGKGIGFLVFMKNFLNGRVIPPIVLDCIVWFVAYSLTAFLS